MRARSRSDANVHGQLRPGAARKHEYREGHEDQLAALGVVLIAVVL
ncbi:hypothetical protein ACIPJK_39165 [Streptomyces roseus]